MKHLASSGKNQWYWEKKKYFTNIFQIWLNVTLQAKVNLKLNLYFKNTKKPQLSHQGGKSNHKVCAVYTVSLAWFPKPLISFGLGELNISFKQNALVLQSLCFAKMKILLRTLTLQCCNCNKCGKDIFYWKACTQVTMEMHHRPGLQSISWREGIFFSIAPVQSFCSGCISRLYGSGDTVLFVS